MEKDKIFFGKDGLTSTSANFVANMAKEAYENAETLLDSMVFYDTKVKLLSGNEETVTRKGVESVDWVADKMTFIAQLKSLIAWLREAIKAKERLSDEVRKTTYSDYGIELPSRPVPPTYITEDDYVATLGIKQRNRYYYLEAFCATIGKYIHPGGKYAMERSELNKVLYNPHKVVGGGRDTVVYSMTPSLPTDEVENTFMSLQQTYRTYQAELNGLKHEIKDAVEKDSALKDAEFDKQLKEYTNAMEVIESELKMKKNQALDEVSKLRIIIPDSLRPVYENVQSMGKK